MARVGERRTSDPSSLAASEQPSVTASDGRASAVSRRPDAARASERAAMNGPVLDAVRVLSDRPYDSGRPRLSFPTLDVASGAPPPQPLPQAEVNLFALLGAALPSRGEGAARYQALPEGELGRGGIGRVFLALDRDLGREVAIKELLLGSAEDGERQVRVQALARFLREARITGQLEHPNIVPVYELGHGPNGAPYYAMRVVRGRTLARALAEASGLRRRLALLDHFVGLCQAIAFAHSRGVVHRDIKPDNVMIGEFGETVVLDWGMAKCREQEAAQGADVRALEALDLELTLDGSLCGTPTHMSPEQVRGASAEVDERSDVWALGVVLYTILCGRVPFTANTLPELVKKIEHGPLRPLAELDPEIPKELSAVAERALQRAPSERYATAKELLADVVAFRSGARVRAYEYSSLELVRRFIARHRAAVVASAIGLAVALVLAIGAYVRLAAARDRAIAAERRATDNEQRALHNEHDAKRALSLVLVDRAEQALADGDRVAAEILAGEALRLMERADARGVAIAAESLPRPTPGESLRAVAGCTRSALEPGARRVACARGRTVTIHELGAAAPARSVTLRSEATALDFARGHLAVASEDGAVAVFDLALPGEMQPILQRRANQVSALSLSAQAGFVAAGGAQGGVVVWELGPGARSFRLQTRQGVSQLGFTPDERSLAVGGQLGELSIWDYAGNISRELRGHSGTLRAFAFTQQGKLLASAGSDRSVRFWNLTDGGPSFAPLVHNDALTSLCWVQDGRLLAFGSKDKSIHLVDLREPEQRTELRFHDDSVDGLAVSDDASALLSLSRDAGAQRWSLAAVKRPGRLLERGNVLSFAFVPGRPELVSGGVAGSGVGIWNFETGTSETRLPATLEQVRALAISADGQRLAFAGSGRQVFLWDLPQRVPLRVFDEARGEVRAVAFSPDASSLAFAGLDRVLHVVDSSSYAPQLARENPSPIQALAFSAGSKLWSGDRDGRLAAWDLLEKRQVLALKAHGDWVLGLAASADGRRVATAGADRRVRVWDAVDGHLLFDLAGHEGRVLSVAFSRDGRLLASGAEDKSVRIWELEHGRELATLRGHRGSVRAVHFAERGALLGSASDDGSLRLWQLAALSEPGAALRRRVEREFRVQLAGTRVTRAE